MKLTRQLLVAGPLAYAITMGVIHARADGAPQPIRITASKFQFVPDHIVLVKGQPVILQLTSTDTTHGFLLRALRIDAIIRRGATTAIPVTPQSAGTFRAICDHYCGSGHGNMKMTVEVRESAAAIETEKVAAVVSRRTID